MADATDSFTPDVGAPGDYRAVVRVRGVTELTLFTGGVASGFWYEGAIDSQPGWNYFALSNFTMVTGLNHGPSTVTTTAIDYQQTYDFTNGALISLFADAQDACQVTNGDVDDVPIVIPGIPPAPAAFNGQFIQVDFLSFEPIGSGG